MGKGQGCCSVPYNVRYGHTQQKISSSSMSQAPRLRNSTVTVSWITALFQTEKYRLFYQSSSSAAVSLLWLLSVLDDVDVETAADTSSACHFRGLGTLLQNPGFLLQPARAPLSTPSSRALRILTGHLRWFSPDHCHPWKSSNAIILRRGPYTLFLLSILEFCANLLTYKFSSVQLFICV